MRIATALLLLSVSTLGAQSPRKAKTAGSKAADSTSEMLPLPIVKLTIEGNQHFPSAALLADTGLKIGEIATGAILERARQNLVDLGFFDFVAFEAHPIRAPKLGYAAQFRVKEVSPLYKVQFAGFPDKREDLETYLRSRDPLYTGVAPATQQLIDRWAKLLDEYAASRNRPKKIIGKLVSTTPSQFAIQFQPDEPLPVVARVEFSGNDVIDSPSLQKAIGAVAYGLPYTDENFREFLDNQVRPLYEARGMLQVRFEDVKTEPVPPPTKGLLVNVKVVEGPVFKLRRVTATGVDADEKDRLIRLIALKPNETVDFDAVGDATRKVNHSEQRRGYLKSKTTVERKLDEAAKTVDLTFHVDRGSKYTFGILTIKGLDLNGEAAVRKQWGEKAGDPFNPDYPDYFLNQIRDQGIFDHLGPTHSAAKIDEETRVADVTLLFAPEEKKTDENKHRRPDGPRP